MVSIVLKRNRLFGAFIRVPRPRRKSILTVRPFGCSLLRAFCAVFRTGLLTFCNAGGIKSAANDVVTHTGQVLDTSASDQNGAVLLKVVTFAGNVDRTFLLVGKTNTCDLTHSGVRLLGRSRGYGQTYAALLGHSSRMGLFDLYVIRSLPFLMSWLIVGIVDLLVKILEYIFPEIALTAISKKANGTRRNFSACPRFSSNPQKSLKRA